MKWGNLSRTAVAYNNNNITTTATTIFIRAQKLYSIDLNTRKKKSQRNRAQPLRNS